MSIPTFTLTKKLPVTLFRKTQGSYVKGRWVEGVEEEIVIQANVQRLKMSELMKLPESDRQKKWLVIYSVSEIREAKQGVNGWEADEFIWKGERFRVMMSESWDMGVLDHYSARAARIEITPEVK